MKIASWNVNSLKVRLPQVLEWLEAVHPDVLALQETKLVNSAFPVAALREVGMEAVFTGQKTYNGVALLTRAPLTEVGVELPGFPDDARRVAAGTTAAGIRVINVYVPNGKAVASDKYRYKLAWLAALRAWLQGELARYPRLVLLGDFNIAPADRDVYDPVAWREQILCSTPEREALAQLLALGLSDSFRCFDQAESTYSWWDYRINSFRRNRGLRIDLVLTSSALTERLLRSYVDAGPRGWERPSDHAPVVAEVATD